MNILHDWIIPSIQYHAITKYTKVVFADNLLNLYG